MEQKILEALAEWDKPFSSIKDALRVYSKRELFDIYLRYEGIIGYTDTFIQCLLILGFDMEIEDDDFFEPA